jgi:hypothetical protein
MRSIILATALVALAPAAIAQTYAPGTQAPPQGTTYSPNGSQPPISAPSAPGAPAMQSQNVNQSQTDPNNCGTPDEPKTCPPMPRHPLNYYPPNR